MAEVSKIILSCCCILTPFYGFFVVFFLILDTSLYNEMSAVWEYLVDSPFTTMMGLFSRRVELEVGNPISLLVGKCAPHIIVEINYHWHSC